MRRPTFDWVAEFAGADPAQQARILVMNLAELRSFVECAALAGTGASTAEREAIDGALKAVTAMAGRLVDRIDDEQLRETLNVVLRPSPPNAASAVTEFLLAVQTAEHRGMVQRAHDRLAERSGDGTAEKARERVQGRQGDDNGVRERPRGKDRYGEAFE